MRAFRTWFKENVVTAFTMLDAADAKEAWARREEKAVRRLGTVGDLRQTLAELQRLGRRVDHLTESLDLHCIANVRSDDGTWSRVVRIPDESMVGDPKDVHHIIPPHNIIGYAVEESPDGWSLETIEVRKTVCTVLRRYGNIVGVSDVTMIRMESYGPFHVM